LKNFCHTGVDKCVRGSAHEEFSQGFKGRRQGEEEEEVVVAVEEEEEELVVADERTDMAQTSRQTERHTHAHTLEETREVTVRPVPCLHIVWRPESADAATRVRQPGPRERRGVRERERARERDNESLLRLGVDVFGKPGGVVNELAIGSAAAKRVSKRAWEPGQHGLGCLQVQPSDFNLRKESKVTLQSLPMSDALAFAAHDIGQ
jgi:hypothetical protein